MFTASALKSQASDDVWSVWVRQIWCDFIRYHDNTVETNRYGGAGVFVPPHQLHTKAFDRYPLLDSLPLNVWMAQQHGGGGSAGGDVAADLRHHERRKALLEYYTGADANGGGEFISI